MSIVNGKCSFVYIFGVYVVLFLIFPPTTTGQTVNTPNNSAKLSFSINKTPVRVGDTFTLHLKAENVTNLAGWQCGMLFAPNVLEAVEVIDGDFLKEGSEEPFFQGGEIGNAAGKITQLSAARFSPEGVSGTGKLLSVTFIAKATGKTQVTLSNLSVGSSDLATIPLGVPEITITVEEQPAPDGAKFSFSIDETPVRVGEMFTLHLNAENVTNLAGWQCDILFAPNVLEAVEVIGGDFLKEGGEEPFFQGGEIDNAAGKITQLSAARFSPEGVSGTGKLLSVIFIAKVKGQTQVTLNNLHAGNSALETIPLSTPEIIITLEDQPTSDVDNAKLSFSVDKISVRVGDTFTLHLNVENVTDLAGWLCDIVFDPAALKAVEVSEGDFLGKDGRTTYFLKSTIDNTAGKITGLGAARISKGGVNGTGKLLSVTFTTQAIGETQVKLTNLQVGSSALVAIPLNQPDFVITVVKTTFPAWDVNQDGQVNMLDMMHVAQYLGEDASVNPQSDVNSDGAIGILDLITVAQQIGESTTSAPTMIANRGIHKNPFVVDTEELTPAMIRAWITQAQIENDGSIVFQKGIANLQRLLASLTPVKTKLLANYPNPFNPETWIPYHLANPTDVTLTIYAADGKIVKTLVLGYQGAGVYKNRSRAAYWDGRNEIGESVASGIYFYTLTAGNFTATRKMLILK